ncbi:mitochondrial small ribosomal subunit Rsm22-domain-containing protein [Gigaspora rosea]|uniref:Mitochondrial small ribosomal subunit Rsm22-domain-containing protein n=1 Tax=Gigaspora rosea TaxID=44941 RepID=A0A397UGT1_9GLOM|nr:mitochondrial small ribosomal subunit Rsm22-domain-containing protein [Gigaspora rosea]
MLKERIVSLPYQRKSLEALFGRKRMGWVNVPEWLNEAIIKIIQGCQDKEIIRFDAGRIYKSFRSVTGYKPDNKPHILEYGNRESLAYVSGYLPITYGPIYNVLYELSTRLPDFSPKNVMDFGTGPGTVIWAAHEIWGSNIENFLGIDISEAMLRMAENILSYQNKIQNIEFKKYITYDPKTRYDLVVSAFTFNELPNDNIRQSILESLWNKTEDTLVLIEKGTPAGFRIIAEARKKILLSSTKLQAECPHDGECPLIESRNWCHFSQRINRPSYLMQTKKVVGNNYEDSKYSYVILRRGPRPRVQAETSKTLEKLTHFSTEAFHWARLILPPIKRSGHIVMDYCSNTGKRNAIVLLLSQGKVPYRDARKAMWGDLFPHSPKKPAERRNIGIDKKHNKEEIYIMDEIEDDANQENSPRKRNVPRKKKEL